jgi:hypothetical protein
VKTWPLQRLKIKKVMGNQVHKMEKASEAMSVEEIGLRSLVSCTDDGIGNVRIPYERDNAMALGLIS